MSQLGKHLLLINILVLLLSLILRFCDGDHDGNGSESKVSNLEDDPKDLKKKPNIIFIIADDAGWNDFSFHGSPQIPTPNIDTLALNGIILNNYYGSPLCTPTRGSIMTGKHPIHLRLQHYVITGGTDGGLPLGEKILPEYLKELGYATHLVGKWHLGHSRDLYTPTLRGFDSHFGYWLGGQDYYTHTAFEGGEYGFDFRSNLTVNREVFGKYNTDLFTDESIRIIESHPKETPLFLMISHTAPHSAEAYHPIQAPFENVDKFKDTISNLKRRGYAGVVDKLDESVGEVMEALSKNGLLANSIIIFTSDNGGAPNGFNLNWGSNWPLRGVKNTLWEGGTKIAGLVWSPFLPSRVSTQMMHVQDWLPSLYEAIGGDTGSLEKIDGVSQWRAWTNGDPSPRTGFLYNIDDRNNNSAVRLGPWKLIQGNVSTLELGAKSRTDGWYGPSGHEETNQTVQDLVPLILQSKTAKAIQSSGIPLIGIQKMIQLQGEAQINCSGWTKEDDDDDGDDDDIGPIIECDPYNQPCLFNIQTDPCEQRNLAKAHPEILKELLNLLDEYNRTALTPISRRRSPQSRPSKWGYIWTNWKDFVDQVLLSK